ncbi:MAG: TonB-dependent receptor plug domain-containing protein [Treponema sp.]|nr:TonB-dependent receptor plug domain-containing protein [Treponema sp.]
MAITLYSREITILVLDIDLEMPLEGAVIRTREGNEYTCDEDGKALIQIPGDRQTVIHAVYPGYETGILAIPFAGNHFTLHLRLSGILQGRELIVEASRPGSSDTRTGRSIAVSEREITQTAEIGIIEDVMSTIKLLPGVNYSGFFNAQPSIRGGHPGDMSASLDGYYINNPYFWGGGFSIFDPRMVQSAQLSHGVFSSRYGHTISGMLEVTTKEPSYSETMFELGLNSSSANFNLSLPLSGRGGILFMGRITYYDPVIAAAKQAASVIPQLSSVEFIRKAPFIRAATVTGNYRLKDNLEVSSTLFWGMDGVSVYFLNSSRSASLESDTSADFEFANYQGFLTSSLAWNPRSNMLLKFTTGTGYENRVIDGRMLFEIHNKKISTKFIEDYDYLKSLLLENIFKETYDLYDDTLIDQSEFAYNAQGRIDFDIELNDYFLFSAGLQEMFNYYYTSGHQKVTNDVWFQSLSESEQFGIMSLLHPTPIDVIRQSLRVAVPINYYPYTKNYLFTTSGYALTEYNSYGSRLKAELGLRLDHFHLTGDGFSLSSDPVLNPRLNLDYNILKNSGFLQSLDISAGTGLFSSVNDVVFSAEERYKLNFIKPNRSWTSIIGMRFEFPESISLNIEGYYKYIFDRMYIPMTVTLDDLDIRPHFDGEGIVWGIDMMLHKLQSRFWDGWISYSYNWAKYRDPQGIRYGRGISGGNRGDSWYFPSFHRFHNLNLILNLKPVQTINIYFRFGIASGVLLARRLEDGPVSYPVLILDEEKIIEKYVWTSVIDEANRTTPSFPFDIKFSIFGSSRNGKSRYEVYAALENILAFVYTAQGNTSFNQYTGQVDRGSSTATYDIPMPIPSFGFKISY